MQNGLGSIDLSTLTWEDYLLIGIVGMFAVGVVFPSVYEPRQPRRKKRRKPVSATAGFLGGLVTPVILLGGGYLAYRYLAGNSGAQGALIDG